MSGEPSTSRTGAGNDNDGLSKDSRTLFSDMAMAIRFYSLIPIPGIAHQPPALSHMAPALPFASIVIGLAPAVLLCLGGWAGLPPLFIAILAVLANAILTGAMAEDAIADSADGLFGGKTREKRLEILKDSRHGTYGTVALFSYLGLRAAALAFLVSIHPLGAATTWLAATIIARSCALWLPFRLPAARADGAAAAAGGVTLLAFLVGLALALVLAFILAGPLSGLIGLALMLAFGAATLWIWERICVARIQGQTGDLIGGLQALLEIAALTAFMLGAGI